MNLDLPARRRRLDLLRRFELVAIRRVTAAAREPVERRPAAKLVPRLDRVVDCP